MVNAVHKFADGMKTTRFYPCAFGQLHFLGVVPFGKQTKNNQYEVRYKITFYVLITLLNFYDMFWLLIKRFNTYSV